MLLSIVEYFIPQKSVTDQEYQRRERLVVYTVFTTAVFALFYVGVSWITDFFQGIVIMMGCFTGDIAILFFIKKGFDVIKAANIFGLVGTLSIYGCTWYSGGLYSPVFPWLAETPIIIILIAGKKSGYVWVTISILLILFIGFLSHQGYSFPQNYNPNTEIFFFLSCIAGLVLIIFLTSLIFEIVRIRAYNEITRQKDKLFQALSELKNAQAQLIQSEKMASLGELTAGIAHEIQNPLNFVNNFSEVSEELCEELQEEIQLLSTSEENKKTILSLLDNLAQNQQKINLHGNRADSIIKNMLLHSRVSTGQKEITDINALADEYLLLAFHGLRAKNKDFNANLITDFGNNIGKIEVVPQELGRVLLNLFNNAFYATQQKKVRMNGQYQPEVKVSTCQQDGYIEIRVRDNGSGIPENIRQKIFQPFFTTKPTGQGTGLGLSISYDIITKGHGGEMKVNSLVEEYTEFLIQLPAFIDKPIQTSPMP